MHLGRLMRDIVVHMVLLRMFVSDMTVYTYLQSVWPVSGKCSSIVNAAHELTGRRGAVGRRRLAH